MVVCFVIVYTVLKVGCVVLWRIYDNSRNLKGFICSEMTVFHSLKHLNHIFCHQNVPILMARKNFCWCLDWKMQNLGARCRLVSNRQIHRTYEALLKDDVHRKKWTNQTKQKSTVYYIAAVGVLVVGLSYAAVPLYRIFCQSTSYGGTVAGHDSIKVESLKKVPDRVISIRFNADVSASMTWKFRPQQLELKVIPGETVLAFYTATNPTNKPITGISTYNVIPFEAGQYFNKIQCFCFEEQMLNPHEQVDMPVFFYIDPEFVEDPKMEYVNSITLSYTFFEAKKGLQLPVPSFARK